MFITNIYANSLSDALKGVNDLSETSDVGSFMETIISLAIPLAVFSAFVLLVFAGYQLMTSKGDPDKLKQGKEVITNAIIGLLFILMSVAILLLISNLFGINISGR